MARAMMFEGRRATHWRMSIDTWCKILVTDGYQRSLANFPGGHMLLGYPIRIIDELAEGSLELSEQRLPDRRREAEILRLVDGLAAGAQRDQLMSEYRERTDPSWGSGGISAYNGWLSQA